MNKKLAEYLGLTVDEVDSMELENHLQQDTGSNGDTPYSYYFNVPEGTESSILEKKGWRVGKLVSDIPVDIFYQG